MTSSSSGLPDGGGVPSPRVADELEVLELVPTFDRFYVREYPGLVALAYALTGSRAHAEDTAQEAMLVAFRRWDEVCQLERPPMWVRRVCANLSTSFVRRRITEARAVLRLHSLPTQVTELDFDDGAFWSAVRRLPRRQAQCLALSYVYACPVAEVAAVLGCAEGTVKVHLSRGRARLAAWLGEEEADGGDR